MAICNLDQLYTLEVFQYNDHVLNNEKDILIYCDNISIQYRSTIPIIFYIESQNVLLQSLNVNFCVYTIINFNSCAFKYSKNVFNMFW